MYNTTVHFSLPLERNNFLPIFFAIASASSFDKVWITRTNFLCYKRSRKLAQMLQFHASFKLSLRFPRNSLSFAKKKNKKTHCHCTISWQFSQCFSITSNMSFKISILITFCNYFWWILKHILLGFLLPFFYLLLRFIARISIYECTILPFLLMNYNTDVFITSFSVE